MAELIIAALAIVVAISIGVTAYLQKKAERELLKKRQIKLHSGYYQRYSQAIAALTAADESSELATYLNRFRIHAAMMWKQWDTENPAAATAAERAEQYHHEWTPPDEKGIQWASVLRGLNESGSLLKELHVQQHLGAETLHDWQRHLKVLTTQAEADAQTERAAKMEARDDKAMALREYRNTLSRLIASGLRASGIESRRTTLESKIEELAAKR